MRSVPLLRVAVLVAMLGVLFAAGPATAVDLILNGTTQTLGGTQRFDTVRLTNGARLVVPAFNGTDRANTGNLVLVARTIEIDATSSIDARGAGYQPVLCLDGRGPASYPLSGGRGGCGVFDSGGGGAHFGGGGRGTKDCFIYGSATACEFPQEFEENCGAALNGPGTACASTSDCRNNDGLPTVAGQAYQHSIYAIEFGAAGGDKGCRDGDGFTPSSGTSVALAGGAGGGRVVLVGLSDDQTGLVRISGRVLADGRRGCANGNDSGGGGAGGSILIVGDTVEVTSTARVSAGGGRGGDSQPKCLPCTVASDCGGTGQSCVGGRCTPCNCTPCTSNAQCNAALGQTCKNLGGAFGNVCANASNQCTPVEPDYFEGECRGTQNSGTCDDCGGGGGGGIVTIQSRRSNLSSQAVFNVSGAGGGICPICQGEAGGSAGELQLTGAYVGEVCDGFDNDFDGLIDEGLGGVSCGLGVCARDIPACTAGAPPTCSPMVSSDASCRDGAGSARPRVAVILDTSASMLQDLNGAPTFGDGSEGHEGIDTNGDGLPNDSRLHLARNALGEVISAYPEIDFALARYHQDMAVDRSCQTAAWIECQNLFASYDNPTNNVGPTSCTLNINGRLVTVPRDPPAPGVAREHCINYAGSCGPPRRGADVLAGFGSDVRDTVRWLDGRETNFINDATPGNVCRHRGGGDCEVRATGPTPLAGSLHAIEDYIVPIQAVDPATSCRDYSVILVTDGAESCEGDPVAAARRLHNTLGIQVYVIAVSTLPSEAVSLNAIAAAGSGGSRMATFVSRPEELVPALTSIISRSIRVERCNGIDDNCNGLIDEGFSGLGEPCDDGQLGVCRGTGTIQCSPDGTGTRCVITSPGMAPGEEVCNGLDDNCNGRVDEGLTCGRTCTPTGPEVCNGIDDDCNGLIDETDPAAGTPCGSGEGMCTAGTLRCIRGRLECVGATAPRMEVCNGLDEDCDGVVDNDAPCPPASACLEGACRRVCDPSLEFPCPYGFECLERPPLTERYCIPTACARCTDAQQCVDGRCVDRCEGVSCGEGQSCVAGECRDCHTLGCPAGQLCSAGHCIANPCTGVSCREGEGCYEGLCHPVCDDRTCPAGQRCDGDHRCAPSPCAGVSCRTGEYCNDGRCVPDACHGIGCPAGNRCVPGRGCVDDPCALVTCPAGRVCVVQSAGAPQCAIDGEVRRPMRDRVIAGGGYEPRCSVGNTPGREGGGRVAGLLLAGLALVVCARRRGR